MYAQVVHRRLSISASLLRATAHPEIEMLGRRKRDLMEAWDAGIAFGAEERIIFRRAKREIGE